MSGGGPACSCLHSLTSLLPASFPQRIVKKGRGPTVSLDSIIVNETTRPAIRQRCAKPLPEEPVSPVSTSCQERRPRARASPRAPFRFPQPPAIAANSPGLQLVYRSPAEFSPVLSDVHFLVAAAAVNGVAHSAIAAALPSSSVTPFPTSETPVPKHLEDMDDIASIKARMKQLEKFMTQLEAARRDALEPLFSLQNDGECLLYGPPGCSQAAAAAHSLATSPQRWKSRAASESDDSEDSEEEDGERKRHSPWDQGPVPASRHPVLPPLASAAARFNKLHARAMAAWAALSRQLEALRQPSATKIRPPSRAATRGSLKRPESAAAEPPSEPTSPAGDAPRVKGRPYTQVLREWLVAHLLVRLRDARYCSLPPDLILRLCNLTTDSAGTVSQR